MCSPFAFAAPWPSAQVASLLQPCLCAAAQRSAACRDHAGLTRSSLARLGAVARLRRALAAAAPSPPASSAAAPPCLPPASAPRALAAAQRRGPPAAAASPPAAPPPSPRRAP
eukprot:6205736-Pleurochrysis_carterae.AAC.1